jgi:exodeoxyribonuclease V alpha subunit
MLFDGEDGDLLVPWDKLGRVSLAYCLTAHKAQGSEWPCVIVVTHKSHIFTDRNWFYTAVTRASKVAIVLGDAWGIRQAVKRQSAEKRRTFMSLLERRGE